MVQPAVIRVLTPAQPAFIRVLLPAQPTIIRVLVPGAIGGAVYKDPYDNTVQRTLFARATDFAIPEDFISGGDNDGTMLNNAVSALSAFNLANGTKIELELKGRSYSVKLEQDVSTIGSVYGDGAKLGILLKPRARIKGPGKISVPAGYAVLNGGAVIGMDMLSSDPVGQNRDIAVSDIEIDCSGIASGVAAGLNYMNTDDLLLYRVRVHDCPGVSIFGTGDLEVTETFRNLRPHLIECRVWNVKHSSGIITGQALDPLVFGCEADLTGSDYSAGAVGFGFPGFIKTGSDSRISTEQWVRCIGNTSVACRYGFFCEGSQGINFEGNIARDVLIPNNVANDVAFGFRFNTGSSSQRRSVVVGNQFHGIITWVTALGYMVGQLVWQAGAAYRCLVTHAAGVFDDDLAAGFWVLVPTIGRPTAAVLFHGAQNYRAAENFSRGFQHGMMFERFTRWFEVGTNVYDDLDKYVTYVDPATSAAFGRWQQQVYTATRPAGLRSHYLDLSHARYNKVSIVPAWCSEDHEVFPSSFYHDINNTEWNSNLGYSWFTGGETNFRVLTGSLGSSLPAPGEYVKINGVYFSVFARAGLIVTIRDANGVPGNFTATTNGNYRVFIYSAADYAALIAD